MIERLQQLLTRLAAARRRRRRPTVRLSPLVGVEEVELRGVDPQLGLLALLDAGLAASSRATTRPSSPPPGTSAGAGVLGQLAQLVRLDRPSGSTAKWAYSSEPIDSTQVDLRLEGRAAPLRVVADAATRPRSSPAGCRRSAACRTRRARRARAARAAASTSAIGSFTMSPSTVAGMKFIAGEPMKPATNRFVGRS